jgi:hypothetical protein
MSSIGGIGGGITVGDVKGLDLESAMMAVQSKRAELLEGSLKGQLESIQTRNEQIGKMNDLINTLRALRPNGKEDAVGAMGPNMGDANKLLADLRAQGISNVPNDWTQKTVWDVKLLDGTTHTGLDQGGRDEAQMCKDNYWAFRSADFSGAKEVITIAEVKVETKAEMTQKQFDNMVDQMKGKIDSLNSSQQMDMLRMQSLTNKRNEAFDLMTNFIKKMADSRSSVLGNMR